MSQHDYVLDNAAGIAFRADANNALAAIASNNSGATAPATTYAYQWWADTTTGLLKQRNAANSAWVTVAKLSNFGLTSVQLLSATLATITGTATAIIATQSPATANVKVIDFIVGTSNAGAATTIASNGDAALSLKQYDNVGALVDPTLVAGQVVRAVSDGTRFILTTPLPVALGGTDGTQLAAGTTAQRGTASAGKTRYNSTLGCLEYYNSLTAAWEPSYKQAGIATAVEYLVIAGGGAGSASGISGGGGAGGLRTGSLATTPGTAMTVTVGAGGTCAGGAAGTNGSNSVLGSITSTGGGAGGGTGVGTSGGSGGGNGNAVTSTPAAGTAGQGYAGGVGNTDGVTFTAAGGGGGSGGAGLSAGYRFGGDGGAGTSSSITGAAVSYAGGGGGANNNSYTVGTGQAGGGNGNSVTNGSGTAATANSGSGGGGGNGSGAGGAGGSGVVIIRYSDQLNAATSATGSPTITVAGGYRVYKWTSSGSITF